MIGRLAWGLYGTARRIVLPGLGDDDRAEMDELIHSRVRAARGRPAWLLLVCAREFSDLFVASLRSRGRGSLGTRRGGAMAIGAWMNDLRIAARGLARRPGFALGVAITLGLGIGATTTVYSVVDGVMIRPLSYDEPSALVTVGNVLPETAWLDEEAGLQDIGMMSTQTYLQFRERTRSFARLAAIEPAFALLSDAGDGREIARRVRVSSELFEILGVSPALGRTFLPEEYSVRPGTALMLTYGAWQRRFGGDPDVVGQPMERYPQSPTIVGVLPRDFRPPEAFFPNDDVADFWQPQRVGQASGFVLGRLRPNTSVEEARAEAGRIAEELAADDPERALPNGSHVGIGVNGLHAQTVGTTGKALGLFLGAAGMLLLLAAMNAATLLVVRSLDRTREFGVRMALGAGRARVVRLLAAEAGILSIVGGALGVVLAYGGVGAFLRYAPSSIPRSSEVGVDARVLALAAAVSLGTGVIVGLLPALRLSRRGSWERLQWAGPSASEPASRLRAVLVGGQTTVAVVLVSGAALLFNSFVRMRTVDLGFEADGLITMLVAVPGTGGVGMRVPPWEGWDIALAAVGSVPGVQAAAGTNTLPLRATDEAELVLAGDTPGAVRGGIAEYVITPGYLETMGTEVLQGRDFERQDGPDAERVVIVNESFVGTLPQGEDPIDLVIRMRRGEQVSTMRIVGVVEDVVRTRVQDGSGPVYYVPYTQQPIGGALVVVVKTTLPTNVIVPELQRAVARVAPARSAEVVTMEDLRAATLTTPLFQTILIGAFALVAMLLAAAGLYGSLAHSVGRRQREIGVRMALGADHAGVLRMVLSQGMRLSMAGLALGMTASLFLTRVLTGFLYGVEPNDPTTLLMVGAVMALVSAAACLMPARRATAVDPVRVLKAE